MEKKINAVKDELRQEISAFQKRIKAGQAEFEERVSCTLDTQLKSVTERVEQQAQELRKETQHLRKDFNKELQATRQDIIETTQRDWGATTRNLEVRMAAVDARTRRTGNGNVGTNAGQVVPPKLDGTTSWSLFRRKF
jgi:ElaB/YqjD/DUF883 family membrane-anchored ribosome-binding protein